MRKLVDKLNFYFKNTTLHGFSYISGGRHWIEKLFWTLAFISSSICCILLFNKLILKVNRNPIIIDRPDIAVPIRNIPFPAISVCPGSIQNGSTEIWSVMQEIRNASILGSYNHRCNFMWVYKECLKNDIYWKQFELGMPYWLDLDVNWIDKYKVTTDLTVSNFGWCKTFNLVDMTKMFNTKLVAEHLWNQTAANSTLKSASSKPYFTSKKTAGYNGYISIKNRELSFCGFTDGCNFDSVQHFVIIHSPNEMPDIRHKRIFIENFDFSKIMVEAVIKITDETLLHLDMDDRRCYKPDERQLQYFKTYTSINCLRECESSFILQKCGCVPYYFINNDTSLICSTSQLECFKREFEEFNETKCQCYPPCKEISYESTVVKMSALASTKNENVHSIMSITAKFKDDSFYPQIRRKYFTMIDWFSFVGGILGLFFGFSFLSAFEFIYHVWIGVFSVKSNRLKDMDRIFWKVEQIEAEKSRTSVKYVKLFLKNSSIHGLNYIPRKDVKLYLRIAWIIIFTLSVTGCTFMIHELHHKLTIDSISIVASSNFVNLSQIPFPAVTIMGTALTDIMPIDDSQHQIMFNGKAVEGDELFNVEFLIYDIWKNSQVTEFEALYSIDVSQNISNYSDQIVPLLRSFASFMRYNSMMDVTWDEDIKVLTASVLTTMSIGRSFNIVPSHEMFDVERVSNDFFYTYESYFKSGNRTKSTPYPWHSPHKNENVLDIAISQMYYPPFLYIHRPHDYPTRFRKDEANAFEMKMSSTYDILIIPEIITTDDDLKTLPLKQRMCFVDAERKLKFFKIYSQKNCELECLSDKVLDSCGCVPYDVIRNNKTKVCELNDYKCVHKVEKIILQDQNPSNLCNCLQPCNLISYNFEFAETKHKIDIDGIDADESDTDRPDPDGINNVGGLIRFKFKDNEFIAMQRVRQFTIFDFLSYIGGLLGLFAGISVLSIFEIFYFFTLRLICEILMIRKGRMRIGIGHSNSFVSSKINVYRF